MALCPQAGIIMCVFPWVCFFPPVLSGELGRPNLRSVYSWMSLFLWRVLLIDWLGVPAVHTLPCHSHQGLYWSSLWGLAGFFRLALTGYPWSPVFVFVGPMASAQVSMCQHQCSGSLEISRAFDKGTLPVASVFLIAPRLGLVFKVVQAFFLPRTQEWWCLSSTHARVVMAWPSGFIIVFHLKCESILTVVLWDEEYFAHWDQKLPSLHHHRLSAVPMSDAVIPAQCHKWLA